MDIQHHPADKGERQGRRQQQSSKGIRGIQHMLDINRPGYIKAISAGFLTIALLLYITREVGRYSYPISILGGLVVVILSLLNMDQRVLKIRSEVERSPAPYARKQTIVYLLVLGLIMPLAFAFILLEPSLFFCIDLKGTYISFCPFPIFVIAFAVCFLSIAGDLSSALSRPFKGRESSLFRLLSPCYSNFSAVVFIVFTLLLLLDLIINLLFPNLYVSLNPMLEVFLSGILGSGAAMFFGDLRSSRMEDTCITTDGEVHQHG